jgi:hypothetical protein
MDRRKFLRFLGLGAGAVGVTALPIPEFKEEASKPLSAAEEREMYPQIVVSSDQYGALDNYYSTSVVTSICTNPVHLKPEHQWFCEDCNDYVRG